MRVTVSLPEPLFREGEMLNRRLRISRSQLYARALELFLRRQPQRQATKRLDAVYHAAGRGALDEAWLDAGIEALRRTEWTDYCG